MLWKSREFRRLLNLIDGLPLTSHYAAAMANDEEYIRAVLKANSGELPKSSASPSLTVWTQEAATLASLVDAVRANTAVLVKINSKPGASIPEVKPEPRPVTGWASVSIEVRLGKHRSLASRLLGDRASSS